MRRYTVAVDFDGVLHEWDGVYRGPSVIQGEPVPGAIEWLLETLATFDVVVNSTRCNSRRGRRAIRKWLKRNAGEAWNESPAGLGIESVRVLKGKHPALIYLDDRAVRFTGPESWPDRRAIHDAIPWHKVRAVRNEWSGR
jgi:hypothetical protein